MWKEFWARYCPTSEIIKMLGFFANKTENFPVIYPRLLQGGLICRFDGAAIFGGEVIIDVSSQSTFPTFALRFKHYFLHKGIIICFTTSGCTHNSPSSYPP